MKNITTNLDSLKSKVDKLDVDKLVPAPVYLRLKMSKIKYLILPTFQTANIGSQDIPRTSTSNVPGRPLMILFDRHGTSRSDVLGTS